jgi:hypothetical protein
MCNAPQSPKFRYLIVFLHSSGCRPYFIFLSFHSVVYSIYPRPCTVVTHPFVLWGQPEILSLSYQDLANEYVCRFDFNSILDQFLISMLHHHKHFKMQLEKSQF